MKVKLLTLMTLLNECHFLVTWPLKSPREGLFVGMKGCNCTGYVTWNDFTFFHVCTRLKIVGDLLGVVLESVQNWKFCKMSLFLARSRFEYCASWASPKKLARHWSMGPSLEMSPKFGKLASISPCKWSIFKLIHYFFPFPCFIYLHLIQFYVRLNKITFLYVWIIENIRSKAL